MLSTKILISVSYTHVVSSLVDIVVSVCFLVVLQTVSLQIYVQPLHEDQVVPYEKKNERRVQYDRDELVRYDR